MFTQTETEYDVEATLRLQALDYAGRHELAPAKSDDILKRAEAYLQFLMAKTQETSQS